MMEELPEEVVDSVLTVLGSHWNRKTRNDGTGIRWNSQYGKWECKVVRHLGFYDNVEEAGKILKIHLESAEAHYLKEMVEDKSHAMISGSMNLER